MAKKKEKDKDKDTISNKYDVVREQLGLRVTGGYYG